ncbi:hypothetical protein GCM10009827_007680 [Dactylosporangium maewongense]|uniref:Uncharacterized protein n=1 Tax=Dactylosporangium maewongense TaxID=634393 RepID=A0ABN1ZLN4_9ACTN
MTTDPDQFLDFLDDDQPPEPAKDSDAVSLEGRERPRDEDVTTDETAPEPPD